MLAEASGGGKEVETVLKGPQLRSSMGHYQSLLRAGLLEEKSNRAWIPSAYARKAKAACAEDGRGAKAAFFLPQVGEVVYGETNVPNRVLGL